MSTSRIYITGQQSVEIDDSEIKQMRYQQARSVRLHVRLLIMVLNAAAAFVVTGFRYTVYMVFGVHLFSVFFNSAGMIDLIGLLQKAPPAEVLDMLKGTLSMCALMAFIATSLVAVFDLKQFGFRDVFEDDLFGRLAQKLNVKKHQIEAVLDSDI